MLMYAQTHQECYQKQYLEAKQQGVQNNFICNTFRLNVFHMKLFLDALLFCLKILFLVTLLTSLSIHQHTIISMALLIVVFKAKTREDKTECHFDC